MTDKSQKAEILTRDGQPGQSVPAVTLSPMTRSMCHRYFQGFEPDPVLYMDMSLFQPFTYDAAWVDAHYDRQLAKKRLLYAIMLDEEIVGGVSLKDIDEQERTCTLSIHLKNDSVKGRGIGTAAERLALAYAFDKLGMRLVNADTVIKNTRSQHVLEKVGFRFLREEGIFRYYQCLASDVPTNAR